MGVFPCKNFVLLFRRRFWRQMTPKTAAFQQSSSATLPHRSSTHLSSPFLRPQFPHCGVFHSRQHHFLPGFRGAPKMASPAAIHRQGLAGLQPARIKVQSLSTPAHSTYVSIWLTPRSGSSYSSLFFCSLSLLQAFTLQFSYVFSSRTSLKTERYEALLQRNHQCLRRHRQQPDV